MKHESKNHALTRAKKFIFIGGILGILTLMSFANLATIPKNSPSTNLVFPNVSSSQIPTLNTITPNPNTMGNITLSWNAVSGAQWYWVYESTSPLTEVNITNYQYDDCFLTYSATYTDCEPNNTYYYVVTEVNSNYIESNCSNCESVTVNATAPTTSPILAAISPNPNNSTEIDLSWSAVNNADSYNVYVSNSPITSANISSLFPISTIDAPQTSYMDYETTNGTYYYAVTAVNGGGSSAPSNYQSVVENLSVPATPVLSSITPNPNTIGNITLTWSAVSGAQYYNLYISSTPITEYNITNWQYNISYTVYSTTYSDTEPNGLYYYAVTVQSNNGLESNCSNCESVTVNETAPTAPTLSAISLNSSDATQISLSWSSINNAQGYDIYMSNSSITSANIGNLYPIDTVYAPQTSWTDTETTNGTYYYVIVAYNAVGSSNPSNCQSINIAISSVPLNTYVGVSSGDSFQFNYIMQGSGDDGTYKIVLTVDNITNLGINAQINCYLVVSNSTNSSINAEYYNETIGAYDTTPSENNMFFINKNIANKTVYSDSSGTIISGTWDNNGVLLTLNESFSGVSIIISRISSTPSPSSNTTTPSAPNAPTNLTITPNPSTNGNVTLQWNACSGAIYYKIYRYTSPITEINSSVDFVGTTGTTTYNDTLTTSGTYYYVVVASSSAGNSPISNCKNVVVTIQSPSSSVKSIPGYPLGIFLVISTFAVILVFLRKKYKIITA